MKEVRCQVPEMLPRALQVLVDLKETGYIFAGRLLFFAKLMRQLHTTKTISQWYWLFINI